LKRGLRNPIFEKKSDFSFEKNLFKPGTYLSPTSCLKTMEISRKEVTENSTTHFVDSASQNEQLWRRAFTLAIAEPLYRLSPDARRTPLDLVDYFSIAMKIIERVLNGLHLGSMDGEKPLIH
jgi:hypothetical protein